jgi:hypothetical protein
LNLNEKSIGDDLQSRLPSFAGADHHAPMEIPTSTFTPRLSASAPKLIDRPFDHRPIGEQRFNEPLDLASQMKKGLPKPTEFLSVCFLLYAHK